MLKITQRVFIDWSLLVLLMLITVIITSVYVTNEHTFYTSDYINYQNLTEVRAIDFAESPIKALYRTWKSTSNDYSDIPTLLLVPFRLLFGDSRIVYILSLALIYLLPFALVLGAIAVKLIPSYPRAVFWSTALLALLTPVAWLPTLQGYPDTGSALLIALAILVYLQDVQLKHRWQIASIGFSIAVAILFRRHFAYAGIAFFVALALQALITFSIQMRQNRGKALHYFLKSIIQISWTVCSTLIILVILGFPFVHRILTTNFSVLYSSYEVPVSEGLQFYGSSYGWVAWLLTGVGFVAGSLTRVLSRPVAIFLGLFASFSLMQWVFKVKELGEHYTLHFTFLIVLGLIAFAWTAWSTLRSRNTLVLGVTCLYIVCNLFVGLAPINTFNNTPISKLFSANSPPLRHADYEGIVNLVNYLHRLTSNGEPIYIAASSSVISCSVVRDADRFFLYKNAQKLHILRCIHIDSRDEYPVDKLLQAQYVVVADPFQYHIKPEEQKVVKIVVDAFTKNWELAQDFTPLPVKFAFANGSVAVKIYKRTRFTSLKTALNTLRVMQNYIGQRPGGQLSWIALSQIPDYSISKSEDNKYSIQINSTASLETNPISLLYLDGLPEKFIITGQVSSQDKRCKSPLLKFDIVNQKAEIVNSLKVEYFGKNENNIFSIPAQIKEGETLVLKAVTDNNSTSRCYLTINNLGISSS